MKQNTLSGARGHLSDAVVRARWSNSPIAPDPSTVVFRTEPGDRWMALALGADTRVESADDPWVTFSLRHSHPGPDPGPIDSAPHLLIVRAEAEGPDRDEFRRWLDEEHAELQVSLPGVNWFRGYEETGPHHSFLNVWSVDDPAIPNGEAWARIRDTPWWARVRHVPEGADRGVYRRD